MFHYHSIDDDGYHHRKDQKRHGELREQGQARENVASFQTPILQPIIGSEREERGEDRGSMREEIWQRRRVINSEAAVF